MWGKTVSKRSGNTSPKKRAAGVVPSRARQSKLCSIVHTWGLCLRQSTMVVMHLREIAITAFDGGRSALKGTYALASPRLPLLPCLQGKPLSEHVVVHRGLARR